MCIPTYLYSNNVHNMLQKSIELIFFIIFYPASKMQRPRAKQGSRPRKRNRFWKLRAIHTLPLLAMNATTTYHNVSPIDTDAQSIGIDNRASACISHYIDDFVGDMTPTRRTIIGYNKSTTSNLQMGTLRWKWTDDNGLPHVHLIPHSFYSPSGGCRLLSPQHWAQQSPHKAYSITTATDITLVWGDGKYKKTVPLGTNDNVATLYSTPGYEKFHSFLTTAEYDDDDDNPIICKEATSIIEDEDDNAFQHSNHPIRQYKINKNALFDDSTESDITSQLEMQHKVQNRSLQLLQIHCKYGHIPFARLQTMAKQGILPKYLATTPIPACAACLYGKATKRRWRNKSPTNKRANLMQATSPGDRVSVDMLQSPHPGLVAQMTGILTRQRYNYATVYVDNYSGFGYVHLQKTQSIEETLESKQAFEIIARQNGVGISSYHADNGVFRANGWTQDCTLKNQSLTFAGVNAHHQNGRAERRIRLLQELTRTQLIHLQHKWKTIHTAPLWPYALRLASENLNNTPNMQHHDKLTATQIFSNSLINDNPIHRQPFGSPTYVLQSPLQNNLPFNKWQHRSKLGLYLGPSPQHARNVPLVLNLHSGLVSPQFHVVHDPTFTTIKNDNTKYFWSTKAGFVPHTPNSQKDGTSNKRKTNQHTAQSSSKRQKVTFSKNNHSTHLSSEDNPVRNTNNITNNDLPERPIPQRNNAKGSSLTNTKQSTSQRPKKISQRILRAMTAEIMSTSEGAIPGELFCLSAIFPDYEEYQQDPLQVFKATSDPDTMYYHQAMKQKDKKEFIKAMEREMNENLENDNFELIHKDTVPSNATILPSVWQMRRKRHIKTGAIKKYKARINVDGSRMIHGKHYTFTYAPVASWSTIRLVLTIAAMLRWPTRQLDYILAFPQAPIERDLYMRIPKGYQVDSGDNHNYVLKLKRNLYGQKQAGRVWNKYLIQKLEGIGFQQSAHDECVLFRGKVIYALYTDDTIITAPNNKLIDDVIKDIQKAGLKVTDEGDIEDFLGVNITRTDDGSIHLHQPHLIHQILQDLNIQENAGVKEIPAKSSEILSRHSSSQSHDKSFHYKSIIGKLGYLEKGSRPDIACIVHQCARFSINPKKQHSAAIRWLAKYLKGTQNQGMLLKPDKTKGLELYVDADFAGNWDPAETDDIDTARSRHGFCIKYANCIIHWKSQLQREIALSSTESEYTGLSYAIRDVIPIINLLEEIATRHNLPKIDSKLFVKVFEDNAGAIEMANDHKYRPRTKHLNNRIHHFRQYIESGKIKVVKIDTKDQEADILTKPLPVQQFEKLRKLLLNW